ncbi:MAG: hypothetical protein ACLRZQ_07630 [Akkermansia muciniphila]
MSANQDNNRELRENRRRRSRFILPAPRHLAAVAAGALLAAVLVHYLGFIVLSWFDLGIHVHKAPTVQEDRKPLPEKIVLKADDRPAPDVAEAVEKPDIEQLEEIPPGIAGFRGYASGAGSDCSGGNQLFRRSGKSFPPGIPFPENAAGGHECRREGVARTISA